MSEENNQEIIQEATENATEQQSQPEQANVSEQQVGEEPSVDDLSSQAAELAQREA